MALKQNSEFLSQTCSSQAFPIRWRLYQFWLIDKNSGNHSQLLSSSPVPHQKILLAQSSNIYGLTTSHYLHYYHPSKSHYFVSCVYYCNSILAVLPDSTLAPTQSGMLYRG